MLVKVPLEHTHGGGFLPHVTRVSVLDWNLLVLTLRKIRGMLQVSCQVPGEYVLKLNFKV